MSSIPSTKDVNAWKNYFDAQKLPSNTFPKEKPTFWQTADKAKPAALLIIFFSLAVIALTVYGSIAYAENPGLTLAYKEFVLIGIGAGGAIFSIFPIIVANFILKTQFYLFDPKCSKQMRDKSISLLFSQPDDMNQGFLALMNGVPKGTYGFGNYPFFTADMLFSIFGSGAFTIKELENLKPLIRQYMDQDSRVQRESQDKDTHEFLFNQLIEKQAKAKAALDERVAPTPAPPNVSPAPSPADLSPTGLVSSPNGNICVSFSGEAHEITPLMAQRSNVLANRGSITLKKIKNVEGARLIAKYLQTREFPLKITDLEILEEALSLAHLLQIPCLKRKLEIQMSQLITKDNFSKLQSIALEYEAIYLLRQAYAEEFPTASLPRRTELIKAASSTTLSFEPIAPFGYVPKKIYGQKLKLEDFPQEILEIVFPKFKSNLAEELNREAAKVGLKDMNWILIALNDFLYHGRNCAALYAAEALYRLMEGSTLQKDFIDAYPVLMRPYVTGSQTKIGQMTFSLSMNNFTLSPTFHFQDCILFRFEDSPFTLETFTKFLLTNSHISFLEFKNSNPLLCSSEEMTSALLPLKNLINLRIDRPIDGVTLAMMIPLLEELDFTGNASKYRLDETALKLWNFGPPDIIGNTHVRYQRRQ